MRNNFNLIFFALLTSASMICGNELQEPFASIHILPEYNFGWYTNKNQIEDIFNSSEIRTVIEVGSWIGGGSTHHIASLLKEKGGKMYCVDTWLGNPRQQIGEVMYQPELHYVYQQFLSNIVQWKLTDVVVPIRMKSTEAAKALNIKPDLIYLDAEHSYESVYQDLQAWYPFVKKQGILCGDDWSWPSVQKAVDQFAKENGLLVISSDNFWQLIEQSLL